MDVIGPQALERILLFLKSSATAQDGKYAGLVAQCLERIDKEQFLARGQVQNHVLIMRLMQDFDLKNLS